MCRSAFGPLVSAVAECCLLAARMLPLPPPHPATRSSMSWTCEAPPKAALASICSLAAGSLHVALRLLMGGRAAGGLDGRQAADCGLVMVGPRHAESRFAGMAEHVILGVLEQDFRFARALVSGRSIGRNPVDRQDLSCQWS